MKNHLAKLIKLNGAIGISQFMNEALFHPKFGYYTTQNPQNIFGKKGDFITAPEISQAFGELIAAYFINIWQNNHRFGNIRLVEMGAGRGTLMQDFLNFAKKVPGFLEKVEINIIEISPELQKIQKEKLAEFKINWWENFTSFASQDKLGRPIFFLANELFDCFPIDQFVKTEDGWAEKMISLNSDGELEIILSPNNSLIEKIITDKNLVENSIFEYSPMAISFMKELSNEIKKTQGVALIIDYGYIQNEFKSTLQAVKNHQYSDILKDVGSSDLTALVDFSRLQNIAKQSGLETSLVNQKIFLESLGVEIRRKKLLEGKGELEQKEINLAIDRLVDSKQMGELFKVLIIW